MTLGRRGARTGLVVVSALAAACGRSGPDHAAAILAIHEQILQAHRDRDAAAWTALEADTLLVASRGVVMQSGRAERLEQRARYLAGTRFTVYRDVTPPLARVSRDGSLGWVMANVEVVAYPDSAGAADSTHTIWAWIELYQRLGGRWLLVGNVSDDRPGP